jgi:hypothetical protein
MPSIITKDGPGISRSIVNNREMMTMDLPIIF